MLEELGQHLLCLCAEHNLQGRELLGHTCDERGVVGFHVVHHEIVWCASGECFGQIAVPLVALASVGSVHDGHLLVQDEIAVITHALGHFVLSLKEIYVEVIYSDVANVFCQFWFHRRSVMNYEL